MKMGEGDDQGIAVDKVEKVGRYLK